MMSAAVDPERYSWVFNAEGKDAFKGKRHTVQIVRPKAELRMDILTPESLDRTVKPHPDRDGSQVMLTTPERAKPGKFLAVLHPHPARQPRGAGALENLPYRPAGWPGAEMRRGEVTDRVLFRTAPGNGILPTGDGRPTATGRRYPNPRTDGC